MRHPQPARPGDINWPLVDRFTFVHFTLGVLYAYLDFNFFTSFMLAIFWEVLENSLKAYVPMLFPHATADTWRNSLGDILAVCLGWILFAFLHV